MALIGLARITDNVVLSGSASFGAGPDASQFAGRVDMQFAW